MPVEIAVVLGGTNTKYYVKRINLQQGDAHANLFHLADWKALLLNIKLSRRRCINSYRGISSSYVCDDLATWHFIKSESSEDIRMSATIFKIT